MSELVQSLLTYAYTLSWGWTILYCVLFFLLCIALWDIFIQKKHTIRHNFPIAGHVRYWLEKIGPELRQYIVANDKEESPFNRAERRWIYASAKHQNNYFGFGTSEQLYEPGYPIIKNAAFPVSDEEAEYINDDPGAIPCLKVIGARHKRKKPYRPNSVINISGMSYGSLGKRAVSALNQGAYLANCYHNTGEGGLSKYHLFGGELMLQIGTGYFGVRDEEGNFCLERLVEKIEKYPAIKLIELKISQGAKPGKGGVLPASKISREIANTRGIPYGKDCLSPNSHKVFHDVDSMLEFIEKIAGAAGLPVGIKCAVGKLDFWEELAVKMKKEKKGPDFIAIDGGEGGTGAAPLTYADHIALPFKTAFTRIYKIFLEQKIEKELVWIGSGKLGFPDRAIVAFAMGCDIIHIAREAMIAIGCIQAQKCHTGHCPTGIATQNKWLEAGLNVKNKARRFAGYIRTFREELLAISHTAGWHHPNQFTSEDIEISLGMGQYQSLSAKLDYRKLSLPFTRMSDYTQSK